MVIRTRYYYKIFDELPEAGPAWIGGWEHDYFKESVLPNIPKDTGFFRYKNTGEWYTYDEPLPDECLDLTTSNRFDSTYFFGERPVFEYLRFEEVEIEDEPKITKFERDKRYTKKPRKSKTPKPKPIKKSTISIMGIYKTSE